MGDLPLMTGLAYKWIAAFSVLQALQLLPRQEVVASRHYWNIRLALIKELSQQFE